jgi:hypothetical protein
MERRVDGVRLMEVERVDPERLGRRAQRAARAGRTRPDATCGAQRASRSRLATRSAIGITNRGGMRQL